MGKLGAMMGCKCVVRDEAWMDVHGLTVGDSGSGSSTSLWP